MTTFLLLLISCRSSYNDSKEPALDTIQDEVASLEPASEPASESQSLCSDYNNILLLSLNIWGQPISVASSGLSETWGPAPHPWEDALLMTLKDEARSLQLILSAEEYHELELFIDYSGEAGLTGFSVSGSAEGRLTTAYGLIDECPTFFVFAGLTHRYFAASALPPQPSELQFLINGVDYWSSVADDLLAAEQQILWSTWWWESDFELLRSWSLMLDEEDRLKNTVLNMLEENPTAKRRILINRFWGENLDWVEYINTDSELRAYAEQSGDDFEIILQGNNIEVPLDGELPAPNIQFSFTTHLLEDERINGLELLSRDDQLLTELTLDAASWHQKSIVVDGEVAYVSGFNTKQTDWDGSEHLIFDPRRAEFEADRETRENIALKLEEPAFPPRRDYGLRVEGPLVNQIENVFLERWNSAVDNDLLYAENATHLLPSSLLAPTNGPLTQLNLTMPNGEQSIYESHKRAIEQAEDYIFIEDQYFRAPLINDVLLEQMLNVPQLKLIVITMAVDELDPALQYTYLSHQLFADLFPDRYLMMELRSTELVITDGSIWDDVLFFETPIYTHSKLRIIDDRYLSVGSCNMNNRGYKFEGELNLSVLDDDFVSEQRQIIFEQLVGPEHMSYLSDDADNNFEVLRLASEENLLIADWWHSEGYWLSAEEAELEWSSWKPSGFLYPLEFSEEYLDIAGPDLF